MTAVKLINLQTWCGAKSDYKSQLKPLPRETNRKVTVFQMPQKHLGTRELICFTTVRRLLISARFTVPQIKLRSRSTTSIGPPMVECRWKITVIIQ